MKKTISHLLAILFGLILISATCSPSATTVYSISASPLASFGSVTTPYTQPAAKMITITNTGMDAITLDPLPSPPTGYMFTATLSTLNLAPGQIATFSIRPLAGLAAGTYNASFVVKGSNGVSVTISPTFTVTSSGFTYSIVANPTALSFGSSAVEYSQPPAWTVYIYNTGTGPITLNPLPAVPNYGLVGPTSTNIPAGAMVSFTIRPYAGLGVGVYNPTVTVTTTNGLSVTIQPTFTVTEFEGAGVLGNPYIIDTRAKLARMRDLVNLNPGIYSTAHYLQTNAIDLDSYTNWTPIGTSSSNTFSGVYDGGGKTISNMRISGSDNNMGLFGRVVNGHIKNVRMMNVTIIATAATYSGAVVGQLGNGSDVVNCRVTGGGSISGGCAGGIVGIKLGSSAVENCYVSGSIDINGSRSGGVAGQQMTEGTIRNCYTTVTVSGNFYSGGIVGDNEGLIEYCYATGTLTVNNYYVGGVAAANYSDGTIRNCVALSKSITGNNINNVGRVVGFNSGGTLSNNFARAGMILTPNSFTNPSDDNRYTKQGEGIYPTEWSNWNITSGFWRTGSWWFNNMPWSSTVWQMGTNLPILQGFTGDTQNPAIVP